MAKCLCGCNSDIDTSHSRGEPKRFVNHVHQQRYYRRHKKHNAREGETDGKCDELTDFKVKSEHW